MLLDTKDTKFIFHCILFPNLPVHRHSLSDYNVYVRVGGGGASCVSCFILSLLALSHWSSSLPMPKRPQRTWKWPSWRHVRASATSDVRWAAVCRRSACLPSETECMYSVSERDKRDWEVSHILLCLCCWFSFSHYHILCWPADSVNSTTLKWLPPF